jgi:hypothetical protein
MGRRFKILMDTLPQAASNVRSRGHVTVKLFDDGQHQAPHCFSVLNVPLNFVSYMP